MVASKNSSLYIFPYGFRKLCGVRRALFLDEIWNKSQLLTFFQDCITFFRGVNCVNYSVLAKLNCTNSWNLSIWYFLQLDLVVCELFALCIWALLRAEDNSTTLYLPHICLWQIQWFCSLFTLESSLWSHINIWLIYAEI